MMLSKSEKSTFAGGEVDTATRSSARCGYSLQLRMLDYFRSPSPLCSPDIVVSRMTCKIVILGKLTAGSRY